jgi:hypothetical protein
MYVKLSRTHKVLINRLFSVEMYCLKQKYRKENKKPGKYPRKKPLYN